MLVVCKYIFKYSMKSVNLYFSSLLPPLLPSLPFFLYLHCYWLSSFLCRQCGFFQRAHYKDKLPQYHAVKIPREDRPQFQTEKSGVVHKKEWATHWSDGTS